MSLSEIGAVMSRLLVGIEEEPSELERICLRVREVRMCGCSSGCCVDCPGDPLLSLSTQSSSVSQIWWTSGLPTPVCWGCRGHAANVTWVDG